MRCQGSAKPVPNDGIDVSVRYELAVLAERKNARVVEFSFDRPNDWHPERVRNPEGVLDEYFTEVAAWELITTKLREGHEVERIRLDQPPGKIGYVMKIELEQDAPILYVKLELGSGQIFGRSFHYSKTASE